MVGKILGFNIACHSKWGQFLLGEADGANFSWGWGAQAVCWEFAWESQVIKQLNENRIPFSSLLQFPYFHMGMCLLFKAVP